MWRINSSPRPRCEGKCREGRYGSSTQDDSTRSIGFPPDQSRETNQASGRISSVSTCAKEKNTRLLSQNKQTNQANSGRQDHTRPSFFMHSRMRFSHVCAHLHVAVCGSSEGFRWQPYRTFSASTPVPRPRCEGKCREGRYGSSPQDDSPRSIGFPPDKAE